MEKKIAKNKIVSVMAFDKKYDSDYIYLDAKNKWYQKKRKEGFYLHVFMGDNLFKGDAETLKSRGILVIGKEVYEWPYVKITTVDGCSHYRYFETYQQAKEYAKWIDIGETT